MNNKVYEYDGIIHEIPEKGGAYVEFPDGSICYIIGILKSIRTKLKKGEGDSIHVVIQQRS